jgi:hypothetical protein
MYSPAPTRPSVNDVVVPVARVISRTPDATTYNVVSATPSANSIFARFEEARRQAARQVLELHRLQAFKQHQIAEDFARRENHRPRASRGLHEAARVSLEQAGVVQPLAGVASQEALRSRHQRRLREGKRDRVVIPASSEPGERHAGRWSFQNGGAQQGGPTLYSDPRQQWRQNWRWYRGRLRQ